MPTGNQNIDVGAVLFVAVVILCGLVTAAAIVVSRWIKK